MKVFVLCAFVAVLGAAYAEVEDDCPDFCPSIYEPLCGIEGSVKKTFENKCKLLQYNCQKKARFNILRLEECKEHNRLDNLPGFFENRPECMETFSPVCGSDGTETRTFPNECIMDVTSYLEMKEFRAVKSGACDVGDVPREYQRTEDCGMCAQVYNPVCGSDRYVVRTFPSNCALNLFNCLNYSSFFSTRSGECL